MPTSADGTYKGKGSYLSLTYKTIDPELLERICQPHLDTIADRLDIEKVELQAHLSYFRTEGKSLTGKQLAQIADFFGIRQEVFTYLGKDKIIEPTPDELAKMGIPQGAENHA